MKAKGVGIVLVLAALALILIVPVAIQAQRQISQVYPEKAPVWNVYRGNTAVEWFSWPDNRRFSVFEVYWATNNLDAVLDHATGLVWQLRPLNVSATWAEAQIGCYSLTMPNIPNTYSFFMGWRMPLVEEMLSLVDERKTLPKGHPFMIGQVFVFWTATADPTDRFRALAVDFSKDPPIQRRDKMDTINIWCVRGGGVAPPGC